ncbi:MAG: hypothetical protein U0231_04925 [Nitrospiraceae bacterium]
MHISGHQIGLLKEYMQDLVEQARQDAQAEEAFGFASQPYRPDQALADLLAILDDRIESEGVQVGLPWEFLHNMWQQSDEARKQIIEQVWLENNLSGALPNKARIRELTYRQLIVYLERDQAGA